MWEILTRKFQQKIRVQIISTAGPPLSNFRKINSKSQLVISSKKWESVYTQHLDVTIETCNVRITSLSYHMLDGDILTCLLQFISKKWQELSSQLLLNMNSILMVKESGRQLWYNLVKNKLKVCLYDIIELILIQNNAY